MFPRVSIIILNWNGWRDTIECLESIYRIDYPDYDVIVVDNGSKDDSIEKIKDYANGKVKISSKFFKYHSKNKPIKVFEICKEDALEGKFNLPLYEKYDPDRRLILAKNEENLGYTGGNNIGIKFALSVFNPKYILLLNNDTIVEPKFLKELVKIAQNKNADIIGPVILNYYTGEVTSTGIKLDIFRGIAIHQKILREDIDCVEGSCMLINASLLKSQGLFDENFFAYWEETDLCMRVKKENGKISVCPNSKIWHKVSWKKEVKTFNLYLLLLNNIKFIRRHSNWKNSLIFTPYFVLRILPAFTARSFLKRPLKTFKLVIAVLFFLFFNKELLPREAFL